MSEAVGATVRGHYDWSHLTHFLGGDPDEALVDDAEAAQLTDQQMMVGRVSRDVYRNLREHPYTREELNLQRRVAVLDQQCANRMEATDVWDPPEDAEVWVEPEDSDEEE